MPSDGSFGNPRAGWGDGGAARDAFETRHRPPPEIAKGDFDLPTRGRWDIRTPIATSFIQNHL
jgi:hypothetical protein